jgi:hypothetical protein
MFRCIAMANELLCNIICHNICCQASYEPGIGLDRLGERSAANVG